MTVAAATSDVQPREQAAPAADGVREVLDFVVMVLILLFVFRAFGAEAFVIPTGSMAPTLMGRHKDLRCANCGFIYQANASNEVDLDHASGQPDAPLPFRQPLNVSACTCPVCRYTTEVDGETPEPSFSGDRIIVSKSAYAMAEPQRYDVAVFRYPSEPTTNYIKRIVGLPGETVKISHGDIFIQPPGGAAFAIARKSPGKVAALLQMVHDNDHAVTAVLPTRDDQAAWSAVEADASGESQPGWTTTDGGRSFSSTGAGEHWLRYQHRPPSYAQLDAVSPDDQAPPPVGPRQLITDFTAYNTSSPSPDHGRFSQGGEADLEALGVHWVGDLAVECEAEVLAPGGELVLELVEGGRRFRCKIELSTGLATLLIDGVDGFQPTARTSVHGPGTHALRFANIDDQLLLWVQDKLVDFHVSTTYDDLGNGLPAIADLTPVGIASVGSNLRIDHLRVLRDNYYVAVKGSPPIHDYDLEPLSLVQLEVGDRDFSHGGRLGRLMSDTTLWPRLFNHRRNVMFVLGENEFLMLGDNSVSSKDSRFWTADAWRKNSPPHSVHRKLLIGKAMFVYWPHSWHRTSREGTWFPGFPNLERMGLVR